VQISVYLTPSTVAAARRARTRTGGTNADIALDAIDAHANQLAKLIAERHISHRPESLFPARRTPPRPGGVRRMLWSCKLTEAELEVIDRLVDEHGARSRSELIAAALEANLGA
jgi:hypothetical protein